MRQIVVVSVVFFVTLLHVNAEDGDPDSDEQSWTPPEEEPQNANAIADQVVRQADDAEGPTGPQLPGDPQLLQQATLPWMKDKLPPPVNAPAAASNEVPSLSGNEVHAKQAKEAAKVAKQAAVVANNVAAHSVKITGHAKKALKHALGALHDARVDSTDLDKGQKESLKKAEAHLREATKTADYGQLKKVKDAQDLKKDRMKQHLDSSNGMSEREQMRRGIQDLRKQLKEKNIDDKDIDKALDALEADLDNSKGPVNDEAKAELERLRQLVDSLDAVKVDAKPVPDSNIPAPSQEVATPVQETGIDIDTQMPYGDLEPFGREDTAQELTENSIKESDEMVDQLERAEVAEEKRSVFRALTRLRGAAITSFDGVARSQTGNMDEYNKIHKWRSTHPLHHLADEESDVSKWAFPDNAD